MSAADAPFIHSMTGFAQVRRSTSAGELTVSLRSVNHRGLDLHFHLGSEFAPFEAALRGLLKENVARGHLELRAGLARDGAAAPGPALDPEALQRYAELFRQAASQLGLSSEPDLNRLLALPGVIATVPEARSFPAGFEAELTSALYACIRDFNASRAREGAELTARLLYETGEIESAGERILALRSQALTYFHSRLREKLAELLSGTGVPENRLAEEAALLAERSDIDEEVTRLAVHIRELRRILSAGGPVGKPVDFLLQEINRETNTILSKSSGAGEPGLEITRLALGVKANIERIREQALNLE
jgi:uncharacterized protein (TIGR00255 family)